MVFDFHGFSLGIFHDFTHLIPFCGGGLSHEDGSFYSLQQINNQWKNN
jgi:hypothetical protein